MQSIQDKLNGFAEKLASIKLPSWLTELSERVSAIGSGFGRILNNLNPFQSKTVPGHATGSAYFSGGITRVNEGGRGEILNLPGGTQIIPHDVSKKQLNRSGNGVTVHLTVQGNVIGNQQYADYIGTVIADRVKLALDNM